MDINSTSAGWTDEKTSMSQAVPPPYHDSPRPGYTQQVDGAPLQYGGAEQQLYPAGHQPATVVAVQPTVYVTRAPLVDPVNDYLCYSIFTLLCCFLPVGIAALVYSVATREANNIGDRAAAERSSKTARILNHVALGVGIGIIAIAVIYVIVVYTTIRY
ncbi:trafficking regulator of GLUT4 1 [Chaetodon auriga]|uniref:trafficking regulator of GLUT4 1 n=1 Tax=Chaetodon auriga TaxID=39042 RepID=UPI004032CD07